MKQKGFEEYSTLRNTERIQTCIRQETHSNQLGLHLDLQREIKKKLTISYEHVLFTKSHVSPTFYIDSVYHMHYFSVSHFTSTLYIVLL